jgi:hypothetical protein
VQQQKEEREAAAGGGTRIDAALQRRRSTASLIISSARCNNEEDMPTDAGSPRDSVAIFVCSFTCLAGRAPGPGMWPWRLAALGLSPVWLTSVHSIHGCLSVSASGMPGCPGGEP